MHALPHLQAHLHERLQHPLPHQEANLPPEILRFRDHGEALARPPRVCAVLLAFFADSAGLIKIPFIQRPQDGTVHAGQIAFPGGGIEAQDHDLWETALRETREEIGLRIRREQIIGTLSDVYIYPSHSLVTPVLAILPKAPAHYQIDPGEVDQVLEFALADFQKPQYRSIKTVTLPEGKKIHLPAFTINDHLVWGATGRILEELLLVLESAYDSSSKV
ncbi:MAG: NUDIX hydrolase [Bernardetiaceae bacterium]